MRAPLFLTLTESSLHGGLETYSRALKEVWKDLRIVGRETLSKHGMHASLPGLKEIQQGWNFKSFIENLDEKPEFIFTNGLHGWALQTDIPTFSILHGTYAGLADAGYPVSQPLHWRMKYMLAPLEKRSAQNADQVVSNSMFTQTQALEKYDVESHVIHPPLHHAFSPGTQAKARKELGWKGETHILFVGNPTYSKGIDIFLALARAHPEWQFHAVTSPRMEKTLPNVHPHSPVSPEELVHYYRAADALVFPSRYEGYGFVPLEALASGCPVIAGNVGILRAHDFNHLTKAPHTHEAFNSALQKIIKSGTRAKADAELKRVTSPSTFKRAWKAQVEGKI